MVLWIAGPLVILPASQEITRTPFFAPVPEIEMPYVITEPCIGTKDASCVEVCPVDCIYEAEDQFYINPDECIDCGACEPECPVQAIFPDTDVPPEWSEYIEKNREHF